jgi:arylsulfatase A-like enzyme
MIDMVQIMRKSEWLIGFFLFLFMLLYGNSCTRRKSEPSSIVYEKEISLIERLEESSVHITPPFSLEVKSVNIDNQQRDSLIQRLKSEAIFPDVPIHLGAKLRFGIALSPEYRMKAENDVKVSITLIFGKEKYRLFGSQIDENPDLGDGCWHDHEIDLSEFAGRACTLLFQSDSVHEEYNKDHWIAWSSPQLISQGRSLTLRSTELSNVILITADTLRADYLNCYGNIDIQTPHVDRMADEGILFENHLSQCNSTLPSHASILSSLYLKDHGIYDNSTSLSTQIRTLPSFLRLSGFQTAAFVSVAHLNPEISGLGEGFDDFYLSPSTKIDKTKKNQRIAEETNKDVFQWLGKNREYRFFLWIHYFDPHTPYSPPSPYRDLYYKGDPSDPANRSMQPLIQRRLEHLSWLEDKIRHLQEGLLDEDFLKHFQTSLKFRWGILSILEKDPKNLKKDRKLDEVVEWASIQIDRYLKGKPLSPEFKAWLIHFANALKVEKKHLLKPSQHWLSGVTDYDFVVSQYMGEVTYMDAQIGELIQKLEDLNLKDSTLLVFTADHGESLGEHGVYFAHRGLHSPVIRVPLIISGPGVKKGVRISTQTDSVDIFPSIMDMLDLTSPSSLRGKSLVKMIWDGENQPSHKKVSFSEHAHEYQVSARTQEFTYLETLSSSELFNILKENSFMSKGEIQLFWASDLLEKENIAQECPDMVRMFNRLVHDWLAEKKLSDDRGTEELDPETLEMLKALGYIR